MIVRLCSICGRIYPSDLGIRFCLHCGGLLAPDHMKLYITCPICGAISLPEAKFCHYCGTAVSAQEQTEAQTMETATEPVAEAALEATEIPRDGNGSSLDEFSERLDRILTDEAVPRQEPDGKAVETGNICHICGQPLPPGSQECPYCQSINVNLRSDFTEESKPADAEAVTPIMFDSFADLFSGDAFREIFVGGGLNLDEVPTTQPATKQPAVKPKPILFSGEEPVALEVSAIPSDTEAIARELASEKPDVSIMDFRRPREAAAPAGTSLFGLPPIPWWGWAGAAIIVLLILVYFVIIPLITHHEPEQLPKPKPVIKTEVSSPSAEVPAPPVPTDIVPVITLLPDLPLLTSPDGKAETVGANLGVKTKATLLEEKDDYVKVKLEDGREGYIARNMKGKPSYIAEADYGKRGVAAPIIQSPRPGEVIKTEPRRVTVRWTRVTDPEGVSYTLAAQYGDGKGTWWDLTRRSSLTGTQSTVEYPSAYPGRVMVIATTRDGVTNSSGWVNFRFTP